MGTCPLRSARRPNRRRVDAGSPGAPPALARRAGLRPGPPGQSLVEFALVLPLLLATMLGLLDLGLAVTAYSELTQAARVGARAAIYPWADDASVRSAVQTRPVLWSAIPSNSIAIAPSVRTSGGLVTVTVTYSYTPITPYVGQMIGSISLRSAGVGVVD